MSYRSTAKHNPSRCGGVWRCARSFYSGRKAISFSIQKVHARVTAKSRHLKEVPGYLRWTLGCQSCPLISRVLITFWQRENSCHGPDRSRSASESRWHSNRIDSILCGGERFEGPPSNCSNSAFVT